MQLECQLSKFDVTVVKTNKLNHVREVHKILFFIAVLCKAIESPEDQAQEPFRGMPAWLRSAGYNRSCAPISPARTIEARSFCSG
jgi:hypothetical protein